MQTKILGIILAVVGIAMMIYTSVDLITSKDVIGFGPMQVDGTISHPFHWPPIVGVIVLVGGVAFLLTGKRKTV